MSWTSIWNGIGAFSEAVFRMLKSLGQLPNILIWSSITILFVYWIMQIRKQNKEAKENGTYP